eukprot:897109-Amphidinium_carterae.1
MKPRQTNALQPKVLWYTHVLQSIVIDKTDLTQERVPCLTDTERCMTDRHGPSVDRYSSKNYRRCFYFQLLQWHLHQDFDATLYILQDVVDVMNDLNGLVTYVCIWCPAMQFKTCSNCTSFQNDLL